MRMKVLIGILIISFAILGFQKLNKYEGNRPIRESKQRLEGILSIRLPLHTFAPIPIPVIPIQPQEDGEDGKPRQPAA